jgi:hypothetical protein
MKAYESAYPGSMCERRDGDYIRRDDLDSLLEAIRELVTEHKRTAEDLSDAAALYRAREHVGG